jgi:hypothetical protein
MSGEDRGALYGWKDLSPSGYPFLYSEITGYAMTFFSWVYKELRNPEALIASEYAAEWINNNLHSGLVVAGKLANRRFQMKGDLENQIYSFDNGMIIAGLANLYSISSQVKILNLAKMIADALINIFFDGSKMIALMDKSFIRLGYGKGKWSTESGSYHSKIAFGLLKLYRILGDSNYRKVTESICDYSLGLQRPDGRFMTNTTEPAVTYLHPHLYSCEGLLYAGLILQNKDYISSSIRGIQWAMKLLDAMKILPWNTKETEVGQSDIVAQLLRLLLICHSGNEIRLDGPSVEQKIESLVAHLANFYIIEGQDTGAVLYRKSTHVAACTWATMFSAQALAYWSECKSFEKRGQDSTIMMTMMDYYV